jgi:MFS transporter, FHS family, L-fucose permease
MIQTRTAGQKDSIISITIIGVLFFIFGFVTWLNATLIPFLKISCELTNTQAYLVTFAFYISYFVMALPSSWVLKKTGFKGGMALGLIIMAAGTLFFLPAAWTRTYWLFLMGLFIQGTGLAVLQTASNPYITILGPIKSAARRISIMGICNKVAGVVSPLILGAIVLKNADVIKAKLEAVASSDIIQKTALLDEMAARVVLPYVIMTIALLILAAMVRFSPLPDIDTDKEEYNFSEQALSKKSIFQFPNLVLGVIAIFVYVGAEVISVDTLSIYGQAQGLTLDMARIFPSYTLIGMVVGYILGIILIPKIISQERALGVSAILALLFSALAIIVAPLHYHHFFHLNLGATEVVLPFELSMFFLSLLGFANAVMWPAIWPLAIEGLGKFTKTGSALLIMGIAGGATLPLIFGRLADIPFIGPQFAYCLLIPCYIYILYFAFAGHKVGLKN